MILLVLLLINSVNAVQSTHDSLGLNANSPKAEPLFALASTNSGVAGGIWVDGDNSSVTYKVTILPCKPCTTGELGIVQITYRSEPDCPTIVSDNLLIGAEYSNGSIESGNITLCTSPDNPIVENCSQPAIWTAPYNDTTYGNGTISGEFRDEYWTWNTTSTGDIQAGSCRFDHYEISVFSLNFSNSTGACVTGTVVRQSQNPSGTHPPTGIGAIPLGNSDKVNLASGGCAVTAAAMLLSYMSGVNVTNVQLNAWLTNNGGYAPNGKFLPNGTAIDDLIDWYAIAYFSTTELNTPLYYVGQTSGMNNFDVNSYLSQDQPVILVVPGSNGNHYVVATCQSAGSDSYSIVDPGYVANTQLSSYLGYVIFSTTPPPNYSGFTITGHSPIQFLLNDPTGNDTGYEQAANTTLVQIPDSSYYQNSNDYNGTGPAEPSVPTLEVRLPANGTYTLDVVGTGTGNYTVDFSIANKSGVSYTEQLKGTITPSSEQTFEFNYSDSSTARLQLVNVTASATAPNTQTSSIASGQSIVSSTGLATGASLIVAVVVVAIIVAAGLLMWRRKKPPAKQT